MRYVDVAKNIIDEFVFTTQKVDYRDEYNLIAGECSWFYDLFCHNTYQINNHTFHNKTFVDFIKNYEPRVIIDNVEVEPDFDRNAMDVTLVYLIIGIDAQPQQLSFVLLPTR